MKRIIALLTLVIFISATAFAAEGPDAAHQQHREEMKKIKQEMRQNRKANPEPKAPSKMDQFWKKEGERSGLGNTGGSMGAWAKNLNPMPFFKNQNEQYKARKAAGQIK